MVDTQAHRATNSLALLVDDLRRLSQNGTSVATIRRLCVDSCDLPEIQAHASRCAVSPSEAFFQLLVDTLESLRSIGDEYSATLIHLALGLPNADLVGMSFSGRKLEIMRMTGASFASTETEAKQLKTWWDSWSRRRLREELLPTVAEGMLRSASGALEKAPALTQAPDNSI